MAVAHTGYRVRRRSGSTRNHLWWTPSRGPPQRPNISPRKQIHNARLRELDTKVTKGWLFVALAAGSFVLVAVPVM